MALQVALGVEATAMKIRKPSRRGRLSKLAREASGLSLVAIEAGSGVLVLEPDTTSLIDLPTQVFVDFVAESLPNADRRRNSGIQKALLSLEPLFQADSPIESIEFIDAAGNVGTVNAFTIERIRRELTEPAPSGATHRQITGRLLELNMANRTFEIHSAHTKSTIRYDDFLEPVVMGSLKQFIVADVQKQPGGDQTLLAISTIEDIPESRFDDARTLSEIIDEQRLEPITDFDSLAMTELDDEEKATPEEFAAFIRATRHDEAC